MRITGIPKSQFLLVSALVVLAAVTASAAAWPSASNEAKPAVAEEKAKAAAPSGADGEIHRKAQRFARLLMDDIKLYNQAKVSEGRKHSRSDTGAVAPSVTVFKVSRVARASFLRSR